MGKTATFRQKGDVVDVIATEDVSGGDFVDFGERVGVASADALTGEGIALQLSGVFEVTGKTADAFAYGDKVFVTDADRTTVTSSADTNQFVGYACSEKTATVAGTILVKLGVENG